MHICVNARATSACGESRMPSSTCSLHSNMKSPSDTNPQTLMPSSTPPLPQPPPPMFCLSYVPLHHACNAQLPLELHHDLILHRLTHFRLIWGKATSCLKLGNKKKRKPNFFHDCHVQKKKQLSNLLSPCFAPTRSPSAVS